MVRTIEVKNNAPKKVFITSAFMESSGVVVTSSGLLKIMHERDGKLHDVIFLNERERCYILIRIGDLFVIYNQSYQKTLSVYLI